MTHIEDVLLFAIAQEGKPYLMGAEADAADPDPPMFDCSELVQWACARAEVVPVMPDGAFWQYRHCAQAGTLISVDEGIDTRGALLFRVVSAGPPSHFDDVPHVAMSAGDGMTVEARGHAWGIGSWGSPGRFQAAALIPGVDYSPSQHQLTPEQAEELMPPSPALVVTATEEYTFERGVDAALWCLRKHAGDKTSLDGILTSGPTAHLAVDGRIVVEGRGTDATTWRIVIRGEQLVDDKPPADPFEVLEAWDSIGGLS